MKKLFFALILVFFMMVFIPIALAGTKTITFAWEQVISPDFAGWKLYKSETAGGPYTYVTDIVYVIEQSEYTSEQVIVAPDGQTTLFYFVITAYDIEGNESGYSNEVNKEFDFEAPASPFSLTIPVAAE